jgi:IS5 family transposase
MTVASIKILILQAWYALSDEALEKQIARNLMFRRFIDLSLSEAVPDHSTIWRFRQLLNTETITRESANEFCWVFFQDILGVL